MASSQFFWELALNNLARVFAPILLLLPFAWETMNVWMNRVGPGGHLNAALWGCGVGVAVGITPVLCLAHQRDGKRDSRSDSARRGDASLQREGISHAGRTCIAPGATIEYPFLRAIHRS